MALIFLLPVVDAMPESFFAARIIAYALVLVPVSFMLHGFFVAAGVTPRPGFWLSVLCLVLSAYLQPSSPAPRTWRMVQGSCSARALRCRPFEDPGAACVGIALARYITSVGVVLIIVLAAIASDLFSVFAGPTRVLVQEDSPILDALLLVFPTFGSALGFGLGVSDLIFLALFVAAGRFLDLRYAATLLGLCFAAFLAVTAGLLLQRPLPALPFIAIAFVIINADLIVTSLVKSR